MGDDTESEISVSPNPGSGAWASYDIDLALFTGLAERAHLAQFIISSSVGGQTFWVDNIYFYNAPPTTPTIAAAAPTLPAVNVISLFSDTYTNVGIDTWQTGWSMGNSTLTDLQIPTGNNVKKYVLSNFTGVEFTGANLINATRPTMLHVDVWTPTLIPANGGLKLKLVDVGPNSIFGFGPTAGDDSEGEINAPAAIPAGVWVPLDIPLSLFATAGLTSRAHLAQFIPSTNAGSITIFIDNVYFWDVVALSADMTTFTAKAVNTTTVLNWSTASEKDNAGFTIERSANGTNFVAIGEVKGNGTTTSVSNYTFTDVAPLTGLNYYRLRQADFNGKESMSKVATVLFGKTTGLFIKNTLVHDALDVTVGESEKGPLSIFNVAGQLVYSVKVQGTQRLDLSQLSAGMYVIRLATGEAKRFVKD
jgi:Secretion system C-terminal sorting domain